MKGILGAVFLAAFVWISGPVGAQSNVWIQIEAQPTLREAQSRARVYSAAFNDVAGYQIASGWYAVVIGPFDENAAINQLRQLRAQGRIPSDSFLTDTNRLGQPFWPATARRPATPATPGQDNTVLRAQAPAPDETPAQARRSERALTRPEREALQEALKWEGYYTAAIDGAFGPGTRRAMGAYQAAMAYDQTGVLTSRQRAELLENYAAALARLGIAPLDDPRAGLRVRYPSGLVTAGAVEAPFLRYDSKNGSGVRMLLISQYGDQNTLFGLYDIMQTLEIVPLEGERQRNRQNFVLTGQSDTLHSYTYAALSNGTVKGFTLIWPPSEARLMRKAAQIMRDSFEPYGDTALDDSATSGTEQRIDLLAGLQIRQADTAQSGFFVNGSGAVITTTQGISQCGRITLDDEFEASIIARDDTAGLALLQPASGLAPLAFARFRDTQPRLQSEVTLAGYSYGGQLELPAVSNGKLTDLRGLAGEPGLTRLDLAALPGDAGGPVLDNSGAVIGMLLPREASQRQLPAQVSFASNSQQVMQFLQANGIQPQTGADGQTLDAVSLGAMASDMTVLVSCWN